VSVGVQNPSVEIPSVQTPNFEAYTSDRLNGWGVDRWKGIASGLGDGG